MPPVLPVLASLLATDPSAATGLTGGSDAPIATPRIELHEAATRDEGPALQGTVLDEVDEIPLEGALVLVSGPGLRPRLELVTDQDGHFEYQSLAPGTYQVRVISGRADQSIEVTVGRSGASVDVALDPGHWNRNMHSFSGDEARPELHRPRLATASGVVLLASAVFLGVGSGMEASKDACAFGLDQCPNAPRPGVAIGLGVGAGAALVAGSLLTAVGVESMRRARAGVYADRSGGGATVRVRF